MLNHIVLIGRLTKKPSLNYTGSGTPVANFTLAVERGFKNKNGKKEVDFINIVVWQKLAETVSQHLEKGRLIAVVGRLQICKNKKGDRTYINPEVVANNIRFLDYANNDKQTPDKQLDNIDESSFKVPF